MHSVSSLVRRQVTWLGAHAIALTAGAVMYSSQRREGNESLSEFTLVSDDTIVRSGNVIQVRVSCVHHLRA